MKVQEEGMKRWRDETVLRLSSLVAAARPGDEEQQSRTGLCKREAGTMHCFSPTDSTKHKSLISAVPSAFHSAVSSYLLHPQLSAGVMTHP